MAQGPKAKQLAVLRQQRVGEDHSRRLKLVDKQAEGVPAKVAVHEITPGAKPESG